MRTQIDDLLNQVEEVEKQMEDTTTSHSDQQLLDQAWEDLQDQIALLQEAIEMETEFEQQANEWEDTRTNEIEYYETDYGVYYNAVDEV